MNSRRVTARAGALAAGLVLVGATAAAAATGSLPDAAQSTVSKALSHVGVDVPNPDNHASDHVADHGNSKNAGNPVGPDATGAAKQGLCTAWAARNRTDADRGKSANSTAFTNLRRAAQAEGQLVKEYCAAVLAGRGDHGQADSHHGQAGDDHGSSGSQGQNGADHRSPVTTPNSGGVDTGATASDDANSTGSAHAAPEATAGSDNSTGHANQGTQSSHP